jgi:hypothetical protein
MSNFVYFYRADFNQLRLQLTKAMNAIGKKIKKEEKQFILEQKRKYIRNRLFLLPFFKSYVFRHSFQKMKRNIINGCGIVGYDTISYSFFCITTHKKEIVEEIATILTSLSTKKKPMPRRLKINTRTWNSIQSYL